MEKLSMCRICLLENVSVCYKVNKNLQETYEKLVEMPFEAEDNRPLHICYICRARLWNCYRLKSTCLQSEKFFSEMQENNRIKRPLEYANRLKILHCSSISIVPETSASFHNNVNISYIDIKIEPSEMIDDTQVKDETVNMEYEDNIKYEQDIQLKRANNYLEADNDYYSSQTAQNNGLCIGDIDLGYSMKATEPRDESLLGSVEGETEHNIPSAALRDVCLKTVKIMLHRLEMDDSETSAAVPRKPKSAELKENPQSIHLSKLGTEMGVSQNINNFDNSSIKFDEPNIASKISADLTQHIFGDKSFECYECSRRFSTKSHLTTHLLIHTGEKPFKCDVCGKCFNQLSILTRHNLIHTGEKQLKCNVCGKQFNRNSNLDTHMRSHTGEKPYKCSVCEKCFVQRSALNRHNITHTEEKPFKCNECGKSFNDNSSLNRHIRTHTGKKLFVCYICGKNFTLKSNLSRHLLTHTGEKPFECNVCGKCFNCKSHLTRHLLAHTGEKPFKCNVCGKCFNRKSHLTRHNRTHTGAKLFECYICGEIFTHKSHLSRHIFTHTGKKPFECNVCGNCFNCKSHLTRHILAHTGEKPFECNICGKCFICKSHLTRHILTHTAKNHLNAIYVENVVSVQDNSTHLN